MSRTPVVLTLTLVTLSLAGCGSSSDTPELGLVTGVVNLNGAPLPGARVVFESTKSRPSMGMTDKDGKYSLMFDDSHAGAALGDHVVRISKYNDMAQNPKLGNMDLIPPTYNAQSTLKREVKPGSQTFDFDLGGVMNSQPAPGGMGPMPGMPMPGMPAGR